MKGAVFFGGGAFIGLHAGYSKGPLSTVKFDRYYGVSAGALWASIMGFLGLEKGLEVLGTIQKTGDIFTSKDILATVGDLIGRKWDGLQYDYLPLRMLVRKYIVGVPTVPVTISRVCLDNFEPQHVTAYPDGTFSTSDDSLGPVTSLADFQDALVCSCLTYPVVNAFVDKNGRGWIDGGFREGGPVYCAVEDRCDEIHICLTGFYGIDMNFGGTDNDPLSGITRLLLGMANQNVLGAVSKALDRTEIKTLIYQVEGIGSSMNFNQKDLQANIALGATVTPIPGSQVKELD